MADRMVMIVPDGADVLLQLVEDYMLGWGNLRTLPSPRSHLMTGEAATVNEDAEERSVAHESFEAHAYEALLAALLDVENNEFKMINENAVKCLAGFRRRGPGLSIDTQEEMLVLKDSLSRMMARLEGNKRALTELLEDDESMALMNLTKLKSKPMLYKLVSFESYLYIT